MESFDHLKEILNAVCKKISASILSCFINLFENKTNRGKIEANRLMQRAIKTVVVRVESDILKIKN